MPTIDALQQAFSVSDGDELMISQSDVARKATRAQLLAGVQPALAVPSGKLLGRVSAGVGAPETIGIGANLSVANGQLSAPAPFVVSGQTPGAIPAATDLVAMGQAAGNTAVPYAAFMAGLSQIPGVDASQLTAVASGTAQSRRLADCLADAVTVESFGAVGDGVTDDTVAFAAAAASGKPLQLNGRVYIVNGPLSLTVTSAWIGVPGASVVRRSQPIGAAAWVQIAAASIYTYGIIFDAGEMAGVDMPAVLVNASCLEADFSACCFIHATGESQGHGLQVNSIAGAVCRLHQCNFDNNSLNGIYGSGAGKVVLLGCEAGGNGGCGACIDVGVTGVIQSNTCSGNSIGIGVGSWNASAAPISAGPTLTVAHNICANNAAWGIAIAAYGALVSGNQVQGNGLVTSGGGICARLGASRVDGNIVSGGGFGIDGRGCWSTAISGNHVSSATTGIAVGGSQNVFISVNILLNNSWAVLVSAIEPTISGEITDAITITENWIGFSAPRGGGIRVLDAAQGVAVISNDLNGWGSAVVNQAMWLHTDALIIHNNRWNNQARFSVQANTVAGLQALVIPDVVEEVLVTASPQPLQSILTSHQADTLGQVTFIKVAAGGSGYTQAQVTITGSGSGAAASAVVSNGQVAWITIVNPGSGYGQIGGSISVGISGDGTGASATGYVGLPVIEGRQLRLSCNCQVQLSLAASSPAQQSWTGFQSTIPALGAVDLAGVFGGWRAVSFPPVDYLSPTGDGGVIVQSTAGGNVMLRPSSGGALHIASAAEATGCTSSVGRGSPVGLVAAPPGSDFRNLNGGAGNTFWIKQANTDATGWVAIA